MSDKQVPKIHGDFLAVVVYNGEMKARTADAIIQGYAVHGLWRGYFFPAADGISRSRNHSVAAFLETSCEYLQFIDADILFTPADVLALRRHGSRDVVVGLYTKKTERISLVYNSLPEGNPEPDANGLLKIAYGGTGFMRIHRRVIETMIRENPQLAYTCDFDGKTKWDLFGMGVANCPTAGTRRYLTEDWMFCSRALALGYKVWADTTVELGHIGTAVYPLPSEIKRIALETEVARLRKENAELISSTEWHPSASHSIATVPTHTTP
jgi:glycosyltransferase involved in cell wall biosynthesis